MDIDVLDVHTQVFKRPFCFDLSRTYKLSRNPCGSNHAVEQQVMKLHQPVDLFMFNDVPLFLELIPDVFVSIAAKLLLENGFNIFQDNRVLNQLPSWVMVISLVLRPRRPSLRL
jgi:hypothetical protein